MTRPTRIAQQPTVPGKVDGIICTDPLTLQCRDCGSTTAHNGKTPKGLFITLSGYHFHVCEGRTGRRRCPECLAQVKADCENTRCAA